MKAAWIITRDYESTQVKDGYIGVRSVGFDEYEQSDREPLRRFKMYDDDMELYYEGWCSEESFDPLDDFGMPNAGCTSIHYYNESTRKYEQL